MLELDWHDDGFGIEGACNGGTTMDSVSKEVSSESVPKEVSSESVSKEVSSESVSKTMEETVARSCTALCNGIPALRRSRLFGSSEFETEI